MKLTLATFVLLLMPLALWAQRPLESVDCPRCRQIAARSVLADVSDERGQIKKTCSLGHVWRVRPLRYEAGVLASSDIAWTASDIAWTASDIAWTASEGLIVYTSTGGDVPFTLSAPPQGEVENDEPEEEADYDDDPCALLERLLEERGTGMPYYVSSLTQDPKYKKLLKKLHKVLAEIRQMRRVAIH